MKKYLFLGFAAVALTLASCSNEETVKAPAGKAISFGNAFVNNSTRSGADLTNTTITEFGVYGYMGEVGGEIFNNERVYLDGTTWKYQNTQYWVPGKDYWFAALAPMTAATFEPGTTLPATGNFGTITYNNSQQLDLLYACQPKKTAAANANSPVAFTFDHMLSRTKFTFTNDATNSHVSFSVSNLKITSVPVKASINMADATPAWTPTADNTNSSMDYTISNTAITTTGDAKTNASESRYLLSIPGQYTVTFDVNVLQNGVDINGGTAYTKTVTIKDGSNNFNFQRGYSYNFTISLTFANVVEDTEEITFTATQNAWVDGGDNGLEL